MNGRALGLAMLGAACAVSAAHAQGLRYVSRTGHYGAVGGGTHGFTFDCDSLCPADRQGTGSFELALGRHLTRRVRIEFAGSFGLNSERRSTFLSAGLAGYVVGGVHVRGAVTTSQLDISDSSATYTFRGGPGFLVGGGVDLSLGRTWALTPYVTYTASTARTIEVTGGATTGGRFHSLNVGASLTRLGGRFLCTNRAGERIWVRPRDRVRALACLRELGDERSRGVKL